MLIREIKVENYRNLKSFTSSSNSKTQYVFGNNGVGKSNLLELLNTVFNKNSFLDTDFCDINEEIKIELRIYLDDLEIGYFDELFEPTNVHEIIITAIQEAPNSRIEFKHCESNSVIPYTKIKTIPVVYYNSVYAPDELNFSKTRTTGKFLNSIIKKYIEIENLKSEDFIVTEKIDGILTNVNQYLDKIYLIKKTGVSARVENNSIDLLPKLIGLANDDDISINKMGAGIRYLSYIFFEILNTISTSIENDKSIKFTGTDGKKYFPIIVLLDEPEIHLHPFMQRKLMKHLKSILNNENVEFLELLKSYFDIDGLIGQLIVTTHSPNILSNNYKDYIRIYEEDNIIKSISGNSIDLGEDEKHLLQHIQDVKEAFFSQCALIFEGISEAGTIPFFANKLGFDLDDYDISVIPADGEGTVRKLKKLLEKFNIKVVAAIDKDCYTLEDKNDGIFSTTNSDFECDIFEKLSDNDSINELIECIEDYECKNINQVIIQKNKLEQTRDKLSIEYDITNPVSIGDAISSENNNLIKIACISWLWTKSNKNMIRGRIFGEKISSNNIPEVYVKVIEKAMELVSNE